MPQRLPKLGNRGPAVEQMAGLGTMPEATMGRPETHSCLFPTLFRLLVCFFWGVNFERGCLWILVRLAVRAVKRVEPSNMSQFPEIGAPLKMLPDLKLMFRTVVGR